MVIRPYSAEDYPSFFENPDSTVTVVSARRTLWLPHSMPSVPSSASPTPQYFSQHYYDLATFLDTADGRAAAIDPELLAQMAKHKATSFRSGWASYNTARPGTLRLMARDLFPH